jgi:hypothetical protein
MLLLYRAKMAHIPSCLRMGLYACISLYLHGAVLRKDSESKLECKNIWDNEDHDAILEEIGRREGLDHDKEASLGDASGDESPSSEEEEDGSDQE